MRSNVALLLGRIDSRTRHAAVIIARRQSKRTKPFTPEQIRAQAASLAIDHMGVVALLGYLPSKYHFSGYPKWLSIWKRCSPADVADWVRPEHKTAFAIAGLVRDSMRD